MLNTLASLTSRQRARRANTRLGALLAFIAGATNAGGFLVVGYYTSHMTGIASSVADAIALHQFEAACTGLILIASFITGAAATSIITNIARTRGMASEFAPALLLEALLLAAFGFATDAPPLLTVALLCFIMGLQNAVITKISNAEIRTTHVTGLVTDIGIELGRFAYRTASGNAQVTLHPDKLGLHTLLLGMFIAGGIAGGVSFHVIGLAASLPLAALLGFVAGAPLLISLRGRN